MKLRDYSEEELADIIACIDTEGFWYSLSAGGYLKPRTILRDLKDVVRVENAIETLREFEDLFLED